MARKTKSIRFVIDTNIARSASESSFPTSIACREVLDIIRDKHIVALTQAQREEWDKHKSNYAHRWLIYMLSKRKYEYFPTEPDTGIRDRIYALECEDKHIVEMMKDAHLLETALATDFRVISMDDKMYNYFTVYSAAIRVPQRVAWVHPQSSDDPKTCSEDCVAWIKNGAPLDEARQIA